MKSDLKNILAKNPIIASLCRESDLDDLCLSNVKIAFILYGDLQSLPSIASRIKKANILPFIHIDFIDGLSAKEAAVDFIKYYTCAAGIVTTKNAQIKRARTLELYCIQRFFVFDAISQNNIRTQIAACSADAIEILPGVIPSVIRDLSSDCRLPFITGGFINSQKEVETALHCGASNITTSIPNLWFT